MGERPQSGKKAGTFSFYFKIYKVSKLQNGVSCSEKPVVGSDFGTAQYQGDRIFIFGFSDAEYKPFDYSLLLSIFVQIIIKRMLKTEYGQSTIVRGLSKALNSL